MSFQASALLLAWLAIGLLSLAMAGLIRQVRMLSSGPGLARLSTPQLIGKPVPDLGDGRTDWSKPTVLLFVTSDCEVCKPRLSELASIAEVEGDKVGFGVVFTGSANGLKPDGVRVFERQQAVVAQFGMQATPFGAAIRPDGLISDVQPVGSSQAIQELVQAARGEAWQ